MGFAMLGKNAAKSNLDEWSDSYTYADLKTWNSRITGICLYMSETSSETVTSDRILYLVHEIDLLSGTVRTPGRPVGEQKVIYYGLKKIQHLQQVGIIMCLNYQEKHINQE